VGGFDSPPYGQSAQTRSTRSPYQKDVMQRVLAFLLAILVAAGCKHEHRSPTDPGGGPAALCATDAGMPASVAGQVRTFDGQPVGNVPVRLGAQTVVADAAGNFSFPQILSGPAEVQVNAPGYLQASGSVMVLAGPNRVDLLLLSREPRRLLYGRVFEDCSGMPIAGARVGTTSYSMLTAADGSYALPNIGENTTFDFRVEKEGYKSTPSGSFRIFGEGSRSADFILQR